MACSTPKRQPTLRLRSCSRARIYPHMTRPSRCQQPGATTWAPNKQVALSIGTRTDAIHPSLHSLLLSTDHELPPGLQTNRWHKERNQTFFYTFSPAVNRPRATAWAPTKHVALSISTRTYTLLYIYSCCQQTTSYHLGCNQTSGTSTHPSVHSVLLQTKHPKPTAPPAASWPPAACTRPPPWCAWPCRSSAPGCPGGAWSPSACGG